MKAFRKWFKALLDSSQGLLDSRRDAAEIEREGKLRESEHALLVIPEHSRVLGLSPILRSDQDF